MNKYVGAHVSSSGGIENAPLNAKEINAKAFAMFLKNQRQWQANSYTSTEITQFKKNLTYSGISPAHVLPHSSYLINLGSPEPEARKKSIAAFLDEINRCNQLGLSLINIHPGSHKKLISEEISLGFITRAINIALRTDDKITIVVENTAGQGGTLGYKFEHLAYIVKNAIDKKRIGVCLDTCHLFAAGYDLRTKTAYTQTFTDFNNIVGFQYLKGMHLNDAMSKLGSKLDRHESIGKGNIGIEAFKFIMNDPRMNDIPLILETTDKELWPKEIKMLYGLID